MSKSEDSELEVMIEELKDDEKYRILFENSLEAMSLTYNGKIADVNRAWLQLHGFENKDEVIGKDVLDFIHMEDQKVLVERRRTWSRDQERRVYEMRDVRKDSSIIDVEVYSNPFWINGKETILAMIRDITERKRTEEALRESEEKYRAVLEASPNAITVTDLEGRIIYVSKQTAKVHGFDSENEILGRRALEFVAPEEYEKAVANIKETLKKGIIRGKEHTFVKKDGSYFPTELSAATIKDENNRAIGFVVITQDITERKKAEEALRESEAKYKLLAENATDEIWTLDLATMRMTYVSPSVERLRGYTVEEAMELSVDDTLTDDSFELAMKALQEEMLLEEKNGFPRIPRSRILELEEYCKDGSTILTETKVTFLYGPDNRPRGVLGISRDITERKQLEKQLQQAQKMEAIGTLAGGIAHDYNNILGIVLGYADLIKLSMEEGDFSPEKAAEELDFIITASRRGKDLTDQMLGFARKGKYNPQAMDPTIIVKEATTMLHKGFSSTISYSVKCKLETERFIHADGTQLYQVINNLAINARDAMPDGGTITIALEDATVEQNTFSRYGTIPKGDYVKLSISDNGTGIDKESMDKIFEPFYTTKKESKGTGLGLAQVYGICKNHGAYIDLETSKQGTTFIIYFPVVERGETKSMIVPAPKRGTGKILVVDDEEFIRDLAENYLTRQGYTVITASNGVEGFDRFREGGIDLVIMDLIMKPKDGAQLYHDIRELDPLARVFVMSGYEQDEKIQALLENGVAGFIKKPFNLNELGEAVSSILK